MRISLALAVLVSAASLVSADARAADRHAGYYYPTATSTETYVAQAQTLQEADRSTARGRSSRT